MRLGARAAGVAIDTIAQAQALGLPIGSKLYLIEFGDGQALELPEAWIGAANSHP